MLLLRSQPVLSLFDRFHQIGPSASRRPAPAVWNLFLYSKKSILGHNLKHALFCFYPGRCRDEWIYVRQIEIQSKLEMISMHQKMVPNSRKRTYHRKKTNSNSGRSSAGIVIIQMYDEPTSWSAHVNKNVRDYLTIKDPLNSPVNSFPRNEKRLCFSKFHCWRKLPNGKVLKDLGWIMCSQTAY